MAFPTADHPKSVLGYHRILSPSAAVRVSPLCLGSMNFGDAWKGFMGECSKETSFEMMDYFYEQGGNFIDTSNNYQDEESEQWIGEWMTKRDVRNEMVIATKFTMGYKRGSAKGKGIHANYQGNSAKSLHVSLAASLKKLQTDYLDVLYVHWWDFTTNIPELMQSLNDVCAQGKVLYLGVSDTPAWIVSKANQYARDHALRQFVVYQGRWSAASRDFEREIIPMCEAEDMGIAPWGALGSGSFKTEEQLKTGEGRQMGGPSEAEKTISKVLEKIAKSKGTVMTSVALAYVMHKTPNVFPIVGGRKVDHLKGNIEALTLKLSKQDMDEIDDAVPFDVGFPMGFLFMGQKWDVGLTGKDVSLVKMNSLLDTLPKQAPLEPRGKVGE